ncbi:hypothetical protein [Haloarchaeobius sp. DFWS5]|uniref:hypothetical protein n=1 Tax=Haloarchaeobius sp. DFWS5 TaxID=3446114 RepID=UPI003EB8C3C5
MTHNTSRRTLLKTVGTGLLALGVGSQTVAAAGQDSNYVRSRRNRSLRAGRPNRSLRRGGRYARFGRNPYGGPDVDVAAGGYGPAPSPYYGPYAGPYAAPGGKFEFDYDEVEARGDILAGGFEYERDFDGSVEFESGEVDFEYDAYTGEIEYESLGYCRIRKFEVDYDEVEVDYDVCF